MSTLSLVIECQSPWIVYSIPRFLGASRYRSTPAAAQGPASSYVDPYTGASRYSGGAPPMGSGMGNAPASSFMDPFTGASRYSGAPEPAPPQPTLNVLPAVNIIFILCRVGILTSSLVESHLVQTRQGCLCDAKQDVRAGYCPETRNC